MKIEISEETYNKLKDQISEEELKEKKEVKLEIKTFGGKILFSSSKTTIKEAVEDAVNSGADLSEANLSGANLRGADLSGAELMNCKFFGRGGTARLKENDIPNFLKALGFIVED